jgi:hypothetical protein
MPKINLYSDGKKFFPVENAKQIVGYVCKRTNKIFDNKKIMSLI